MWRTSPMQLARKGGSDGPRIQSHRWPCQFRGHRSARSSFPRRQEQMTGVRNALKYSSSALRPVRFLLRHLPGVTMHNRKAATPLPRQAFRTTQHLCSRSRIYQITEPDANNGTRELMPKSRHEKVLRAKRSSRLVLHGRQLGGA